MKLPQRRRNDATIFISSVTSLLAAAINASVGIASFGGSSNIREIHNRIETHKKAGRLSDQQFQFIVTAGEKVIRETYLMELLGNNYHKVAACALDEVSHALVHATQMCNVAIGSDLANAPIRTR